MTEAELRKLTKKELVHLLYWVVGAVKVKEEWVNCRACQQEHMIKCYDCDSIAKKLGEKEV